MPQPDPLAEGALDGRVRVFARKVAGTPAVSGLQLGVITIAASLRPRVGGLQRQGQRLPAARVVDGH
ncbi:Uncharacterised protein [Mycobacteroides abscessus subsp. abscessus]|nr:Uncharacterised protein [Mycobacteroides abscessus subsp. abscessus]